MKRTKKHTEWFAALRSGKFVQGERRLATVYSDGRVNHCCLGVEAEINDDIPFEFNFSFDTSPIQRGEITSSSLNGIESTPYVYIIPEEYAVELGLTEKLQDYLASMNDGSARGEKRIGGPNRDFNFIARFLEIVFPE